MGARGVARPAAGGRMRSDAVGCGRNQAPLRSTVTVARGLVVGVVHLMKLKVGGVDGDVGLPRHGLHACIRHII